MRHISYLILFILVTIFGQKVSAQEIFVDISCTNQYPGVGEKIKLSYVLKMKLKGGMASVSHSGITISKPDMKSMNIIDEGTEGSSFSFGNFGGGSDMQISKYSFILQPTKEGDIKVEPFSFKMNGETYQSESFTIHVGKGDPNAQIVKKNSNYFITIDVSKKELFPGEHALVTYTLYSRSTNISVQNYDFPMPNGLWKEEIDGGSNGFGQSQVTIDGYAYLKFPLKKEVIFAQKSGEIQIPAFTLDLMVGGGFFSKGSLEKLTSNSPTINVKPLPSGAPISYNGQVGNDYQLDVNYSTTQLTAGEPIDVKIKINGKGNLKQLDAPELTFPSDFDTYEPEVEGTIKLSGTNGFTGDRTFNYLVIPRHHGTYEIPSFEFSYFDLSTKTYKTLSYPAQSINVEKSATSTAATTNGSNNASVAKEEVEVLNDEIRHIAYNTSLNSTETTFFGTSLFWIGIGFPFLLAIGNIFFVAFKPAENKIDHKKAAGKNIFKTLKNADIKLTANDTIGFYEELYKGFMTYLSQKLDTPFSQLTKEEIALKLADIDLSNNTIKILEVCEMARYTPLTSADAHETMNKTKNLIQQIEKHVS
ncbi:MAG: protein BatD [Flavobacteriales bacterium]|nr:protein BatD [Flavobacteriales bacterium]